MDKARALAWFAEVAQKGTIRRDKPTGATRWGSGESVRAYDEAAALAFVVAAEQLLKRVFPIGDFVIERWDAIFARASGHAGALTDDDNVDAALALFREAHSMVASDRIGSLLEGVRAETAGELLDQAETLVAGGYHVAAAVLAGGALETTLRHICDKVGVTPSGDGSITKYEMAIAQERKKGCEILTATDGKLVTSWGGLRNDAAHTPAKFSTDRSPDEVRLMVQGIRQFIARVVV